MDIDVIRAAFGEERQKPARPDIRAQRMELRARFNRYCTGHAFGSGDLIAEKDGLAHIKDTPNVALIFWRYLDRNDPLDDAIITDAVGRMHLSDINCVVAFADETGKGLIYWPADFHEFRPLTAEEQAALDACDPTFAEVEGASGVTEFPDAETRR